MKFFKKNQIIIYVIALMLVAAGYLNYTSTEHDPNSIIQTTTDAEQLAGTKNIGDAQLVSGNVTTNMAENTSENGMEGASENMSTNEDTNTLDTIDTAEIVTDRVNEAKTNTTNTSSTLTTSSLTKDDYFTKSKLERETMYSQMLETYEKVLNGINSLETQKQSASEEIKKINETKNSIMICENLIATKGFENCVIFVNGGSVSVIIGAEEITQEEMAQLQNILSRELNAEIENIHISLK